MYDVTKDQLDLIRESAQVCRDAAAHTMHVTLNNDETSILMIDDLIAREWPKSPPRNPAKAYHIWGCFIGEAMCASLGGKWVSTEAGLGVAVGNFVAHPYAKIEKRFINGMNDSVSFFYKVFKQQVCLRESPKHSWWPFNRKK